MKTGLKISVITLIVLVVGFAVLVLVDDTCACRPPASVLAARRTGWPDGSGIPPSSIPVPPQVMISVWNEPEVGTIFEVRAIPSLITNPIYLFLLREDSETDPIRFWLLDDPAAHAEFIETFNSRSRHLQMTNAALDGDEFVATFVAVAAGQIEINFRVDGEMPAFFVGSGGIEGSWRTLIIREPIAPELAPDIRLVAELTGRDLDNSVSTIFDLAWSPDGKRLVTNGSDDSVAIWNVEAAQVEQRLFGHTVPAVFVISWSPNGKYIVTGGMDKVVDVWDAETGDLLYSLYDAGNWIRSVAWSPDGKLFATGDSNNVVRVWNAESGGLLWRLTGHRSDVLGMAWSPDGRLLATVDAGIERSGRDYIESDSYGFVMLWDIETGEQVAVLRGHTYVVIDVDWSPDGSRLATIGLDDTVRIWDVTTGETLFVLAEHTDDLHAVAWSPNGRYIASGGTDAILRIWDAERGQIVKRVYEFPGAIYAIDWSPDGRWLAYGGGGGLVRIVEVSSPTP